jgi:hypothetical protein
MSRICIPVPASTVIGVSSTPPTTPNSNVFRVDSSITTLAGLKALATSTGVYPAGICVFLPNLDVPATYQLVSGTDADNSPYVLRPDDYSGGNQKVWKQRM